MVDLDDELADVQRGQNFGNDSDALDVGNHRVVETGDVEILVKINRLINLCFLRA